jgi:dTDP-glucose pyrophosphorylase
MSIRIHNVILDVGFIDDKERFKSKNKFLLNENNCKVTLGEKIIEIYSSEYSTLIIENGYFDSLPILSTGGGISNKFILEYPTKGALATAALGITSIIKDNNPIIICPGDSLIPKKSLQKFTEHMLKKDAVAGTIIFKSIDPKFSYVRINRTGNITEVAEKKVISDLATAGVHFYRSKLDFLKACQWSFVNTYNFHGNYYLAPSLNYFIMENQKIEYFEIETEEYARFSTHSEAILSEGKMAKYGSL